MYQQTATLRRQTGAQNDFFVVSCNDNSFAVTMIAAHGRLHTFDGKCGGGNTLKDLANLVGGYNKVLGYHERRLFAGFRASISGVSVCGV